MGSGSMGGEKIQQLKDAMFTVLDDLTESDFFNMIEFSSGVSHWSGEGFTGSNTEFYPATEENKNKAIKSVIKLSAGGGTNLNDAILAGLGVAETALQREALPKDVKSLIVFLTDGHPSEGVTHPESIKSNIKTKNRDLQVPVFTVAFGADTDLSLLQSIASQNNAVSKRIYEGSDAALQLEDFYAQISSPVLSNLNVEYVGGIQEASPSTTELNTFFRGGEFIVSGKLEGSPGFGVKISGLGKAGLPYHREFDICPGISASQCLQPRVFPKSEAQSFLQKLFAFQHIKQVLDKADIAETEEGKTELKEKATELSLENNLVTDVTSLVVVKPDQEPKVTQLTNLRQTDYPDYGYNYASYAYAAPAYQSYSVPASSASGYSAPRPSSINRRPQPPIQQQISFSSNSNYAAIAQGASIPGFSSYTSTTIPPPSFVQSLGSSAANIVSSIGNTIGSMFRPKSVTTTTATTTATITTATITTPRPRPRFPSPAPAGDCYGAGKLVLYSKTYHRGDQLELTQSQSDLAGHQFDQTAVSALVTGDCCWE